MDTVSSAIFFGSFMLAGVLCRTICQISISNDFLKINSYLICSTRQIKYEFGSGFPEVRWLSETASP